MLEGCLDVTEFVIFSVSNANLDSITLVKHRPCSLIDPSFLTKPCVLYEGVNIGNILELTRSLGHPYSYCNSSWRSTAVQLALELIRRR